MNKPQCYWPMPYISPMEREVAAKYFSVVANRSEVKDESLVLIRYPFHTDAAYRELMRDFGSRGILPINSLHERMWITSFSFAQDPECPPTPKTWFNHDFSFAGEGPFVVRSRYKSGKEMWKEEMLANTKRDAMVLGRRIGHYQDHGMLDVVYREYVRFKKISEVNDEYGLPPCINEWRVFVLSGKVLFKTPYWEESGKEPPEEFLNKVTRYTSHHVRFAAVDIAEVHDGRWMIVEINDGQSAGLQGINTDLFYSTLRREIYK